MSRAEEVKPNPMEEGSQPMSKEFFLKEIIFVSGTREQSNRWLQSTIFHFPCTFASTFHSEMTSISSTYSRSLMLLTFLIVVFTWHSGDAQYGYGGYGAGGYGGGGYGAGAYGSSSYGCGASYPSTYGSGYGSYGAAYSPYSSGYGTGYSGYGGSGYGGYGATGYGGYGATGYGGYGTTGYGAGYSGYGKK
ncbi:hypothetical protein DdX_03900 [Ditylenchus destructor]|uniref:Uncharacterized protein n=1 Tax=Ditylenchus destructor TaxID=166010 RepID=A0AAD4RBK8_9BILA|nr:hypothetical protein DdX_03900 [Ditylenchus destructor]